MKSGRNTNGEVFVTDVRNVKQQETVTESGEKCTFAPKQLGKDKLLPEML